MAWAFILFSLMMLPTMMNYKTGDNYAEDPRVGYANGMISNLGYSTVECISTPVSLGKMTVSCSYGVVGEILEYGINNEDMGGAPDACINNKSNSVCKPNSSRIASTLASSIGKESKLINFSLSDMYNTSNTNSICKNSANDFFLQYTCIQSNAELSSKYNFISLAVSTACLISLLFVLLLQWLYKGGNIMQIEWDLATVTLGDYAVEFEIPAEAY